MNKTEIHIVDKTPFSVMMKQSKALYNTANYVMRQAFEYHYGNRLYKDCDAKYRKIFKEKMIGYYELEKHITSNLPSWTRQQILMKLDKDWKSFYALKGTKRGLPGFKQLEFMLIFEGRRVKSGFLLRNSINYELPKSDKIKEAKQIRIIPYSRRKVQLEIIYEAKELPMKKSGQTMGIDLGLNNLATCVTQEGKAVIFNGKPLKAMNKYYNLKVAQMQSRGKKIKEFAAKRNRKINDYLHKTSKKVVELAISENVKTIAVGKNVNWKQECKLKNFVQIPHARLIQQIQYKAALMGIEVVLTEESYTSKVDHLGKETIEKHDEYLGKRVKRGLFQSTKGLLNADVNGAIGIMRKVIGDKFLGTLVNKGFVYNPVRIATEQFSRLNA